MRPLSCKDSLTRTNAITNRFKTIKEVLRQYNPSAQMTCCADPRDCHIGNHPYLSELKAYGSNAPSVWLTAQLYNLSEFCGARDKLTGDTLVETAQIIANTCYYLRLTELMLFFYRFKSGDFGRFYGTVDPMIIISSLKAYIHERNATLDRYEQEERMRKMEDERQMSVPWDEYCRLQGISKPNPIQDFRFKQ